VSILRDQILSAQDIPSEKVEVPEWGVTVEVRGMTGAERTRIMDLAMDEGGELKLQLVYPEIVIATAFDPEAGQQIFQPSDRDALLSKSANALDRLALVGMRLSGFTQEDADKAGKGSSETPTDAPSSN
jgi:hypothetical protein